MEVMRMLISLLYGGDTPHFPMYACMDLCNVSAERSRSGAITLVCTVLHHTVYVIIPRLAARLDDDVLQGSIFESIILFAKTRDGCNKLFGCSAFNVSLRTTPF
jgi:hypothetical protein